MNISTRGLQKIGKGMFSTCYKLNDEKVLLISDDPVKECMAHKWFPNSRLFPRVEFHDSIDNGYVMGYYPKQKSLKNALKPDQYQLYKDLRKMYNDINFYQVRDHLLADQLMNHIEASNLKRSIKNHLVDAVSALKNYGGDVMFEISPRNVAVSKTGNLILLDCFFMRSKLKR